MASVLALLAMNGSASSWLGFIIFTILFIASVFSMVCAITRGFRGIKVTIVTVLFIILYFVVDILISIVFEILNWVSIFTQVLNMIVNAVVSGVLFDWCFRYVAKKTEGREWSSANLKKRLMPAYVVGVVSILVILGSRISSNPAKNMVSLVDKQINSAQEYLNELKVGKAIPYYDLALDYMNVLRHMSDLEYSEKRLNASLENDEREFVKYLIWEKREQYNKIKEFYITVDKDVNIGIQLLDHYYQILQENEKNYESRHKEITDTIISQMIAEGNFTNSLSFISDIQSYGSYYEEKFEKYAYAEDMLTALQILERVGTSGDITKNDMKVLLECADNQSDNIFMQYIVVTCGTYYRIDDADHYEGTARCIERIIENFEMVADGDVSKGKSL